MLCPLKGCDDAKATAPPRLTVRPPSPAATWPMPAARFALPRITSEPSRSSTACQKISGMSSPVPGIARSILIVVASISCARSIRAPMSASMPDVV